MREATAPAVTNTEEMSYGRFNALREDDGDNDDDMPSFQESSSEDEELVTPPPGPHPAKMQRRNKTRVPMR